MELKRHKMALGFTAGCWEGLFCLLANGLHGFNTGGLYYITGSIMVYLVVVTAH